MPILYPLGTLESHVDCDLNVFTMYPVGIWALVPSVYINNMECALATLTSRMDAMEDKVCRCNDVQVEEVVEEEDDPTSELSYESQSLGTNTNLLIRYMLIKL